jgi:hypothetical protein
MHRVAQRTMVYYGDIDRHRMQILYSRLVLRMGEASWPRQRDVLPERCLRHPTSIEEGLAWSWTTSSTSQSAPTVMTSHRDEDIQLIPASIIQAPYIVREGLSQCMQVPNAHVRVVLGVTHGNVLALFLEVLLVNRDDDVRV